MADIHISVNTYNYPLVYIFFLSADISADELLLLADIDYIGRYRLSEDMPIK